MEEMNIYLFIGIFISTIMATFIFTNVKTKEITHLPIVMIYPITMTIGVPAVFMPLVFSFYIMDLYGVLYAFPSLVLILSGFYLARFAMKKFIFI